MLDPWTNTPMPGYNRPETLFQYISYVGVPIEKAVEWVWRVRKWKLTISVSVSGSVIQSYPPRLYTAGPLTAESIAAGRYINFPNLVSREREIPLQNFGNIWMQSGQIQNGPVPTTQDGQLSWLNHPRIDPVYLTRAKIDIAAKKVYLPFSCAVNVGAWHTSGGDITTIVFGEMGAQQFTAYIDGIPTIWEYSISDSMSVTGISVSVDPIEYWPYAAPDKVLYPRAGYNVGDPHPNAGLPIYDTATGATLRDPVSGF